MKTILWLYSKPLNPEAGGTERITSLVQRGLTKAGYCCMDILVLDTINNRNVYHDEEIKDIYGFLKGNNVDVVINQWGQLPAFLRYFLDNGGKRWHDEGGRIISCLHFHPAPPTLYHNFAVKWHRTWHDYYVMLKARLFADYYAKQDQRRVGEAYRWVYDHSDAFVMLSESFRKYIVEAMGIEDDSKLVAINNPLTFEETSDESILNRKENVILVVSRMYEWHKRISISLKAWKELSAKASMQDWRLVIVGTGEDLSIYKQYVEQHNINRVSFEGQQSPKQYYDKAKIFLMTSEREGWGLTITEAMQRGVVPIALDTSSAFHDIIADGDNGFLVSEGQLRKFSKRIEQLVTDNVQWQTMAKNALVSAQRFSLDKITEDWKKIIDPLGSATWLAKTDSLREEGAIPKIL